MDNITSFEQKISELGINKKPSNRKEEILYAAVIAIAEHGLADTTHRSIAKEAGIPLGSTTYYFKKLSDIHKSAYELFQQFTEENTQQLFDSANSSLAKHVSGSLNRDDFVEQLTEAAVQYVNSIVTKQLMLRKFEAAFLHAGTSDEQVGSLMSARHAFFVKKCAAWFENAQVAEPMSAAHLFLGLTNHLERCNTLINSELAGEEICRENFYYFFSSVLP